MQSFLWGRTTAFFLIYLDDVSETVVELPTVACELASLFPQAVAIAMIIAIAAANANTFFILFSFLSIGDCVG